MLPTALLVYLLSSMIIFMNFFISGTYVKPNTTAAAAITFFLCFGAMLIPIRTPIAQKHNFSMAISFRSLSLMYLSAYSNNLSTAFPPSAQKLLPFQPQSGVDI